MVADITKPVSRIEVNEELVAKWVKEERGKKIQEINKHFSGFSDRFLKATTDEKIVKLTNKPLYYVTIGMKHKVLPDPQKIKLKEDRMPEKVIVSETEQYWCRELLDKEVQYLFTKKEMKKNPLLVQMSNDTYLLSAVVGNKEQNYFYVVCKKDNSLGYWDINNQSWSSYYSWTSSSYCKLPIIDLDDSNISRLELFLKYDFIPEFNDETHGAKDKEIFTELQKLYAKKLIYFPLEADAPFLSGTAIDMIHAGSIDSVLNMRFATEKDILSKAVELTGEEKKQVYDNLLRCDYNRAEIEIYPEKILEDVNSGHWELWADEKAALPQNNNQQNNKQGKNNKNNSAPVEMKSSAGKKRVDIKPSLVARNPLADVRRDGIVGIDFGTKSTIVVYQNGSDTILPMRVGSGKYKKALKQEDFENPTVMEFRDIESFLADYAKKKGRPETKWSDITVSHKAAEQLKNGNDSSQYYSFFSDLKQWSGDRSRKIRVKDNKGHEELLPAFVDIGNSGFNPLELYAYYLGLFINNMYNGIYLNYILSFPVTYEKEVREKIVASFEKGIKKSLPEAVLNDKQSMEEFRIVQGASEPAAYAICALEEYGFDPAEGEKVFYGIFDFGGGTTDFDFGIWRAAEDSECRRFDYVIEHFGAGGDRYLGGENLLEMLAFHVFKNNKENLLKSDIEFFKPAECKEFAGQQMLISNSQEARLNTRQLMEKLRGLWQDDDPEAIKAIESGKIKLLLFNKQGKTEVNFELAVNKEELLALLRERIQKGVNNFFNALKLNFKKEYLSDVEGIHIFLAGNSSKSKIVRELFKEYLDKKTAEIIDKSEGDGGNKEFFHVYPPLGTEEAKQIQQSKGIKVVEDITNPRPTGKTGVAYGLIEGRPGSRIKVVSEVKSSDEIKFKYYIGENRKKCFHVVLDRELVYQKWYSFIDASEPDFEFYYTSLPEATTKHLPITEESIAKKICRTDVVDEAANVYIRAVAPGTIEYVVARPKEIDQNKYLGKIKQVTLD